MVLRVGDEVMASYVSGPQRITAIERMRWVAYDKTPDLPVIVDLTRWEDFTEHMDEMVEQVVGAAWEGS